MQEIQFLEFMGGSNLLQAFPNYLICLRFIRISTVGVMMSVGISFITFTRDVRCSASKLQHPEREGDITNL